MIKGHDLQTTNVYLKFDFDLYFITLKLVLKFQINQKTQT